MSNHGLVLVLCSIVFLVANEHVISHGHVEARRIAVQDGGLKHEATITTLKDQNGDTTDCVDVYKQPAFRHMLIKDIQMEPSSYPEDLKTDKSTPTVTQGFEGCPQGTIPIRRSTSSNNQLRRRTSLPSILGAQSNQSHQELDSLNQGHEYTVASTEFSTYHGAQARVSLWNPKVEGGQEMSISQMWLLANSTDNDLNSLNTIEAGWTVNPDRYKDNLTRFFIYWTSDGYQTTGCFDLDCPGFVQTNPNFTIGGVLKPISIYGHDSNEIIITVYKDNDTRNYWLAVNGDNVGYWPKSIFNTLANGATQVQFGGEITNTQLSGHHTSTAMGSGHFPAEGHRKSSYFNSLLIFDGSDVPRIPENLRLTVSNPNCYDLQVLQDTTPGFGTMFYYGGPGYSPSCQ